MRIYKPYLLSNSRLEDQITCLNLVYPRRVLLVSKRWYSDVLKHDLLDDCCFHMVVCKYKFHPLTPILYEKET